VLPVVTEDAGLGRNQQCPCQRLVLVLECHLTVLCSWMDGCSVKVFTSPFPAWFLETQSRKSVDFKN
jgi:hypothetical protein